MKQDKSAMKKRVHHRAMPDIGNIVECVEDVKGAVLDTDAGPSDPLNYERLRARLEISKRKLSPLYRQNVFDPFAGKLDELGKAGFRKILVRDPKRENIAGMMRKELPVVPLRLFQHIHKGIKIVAQAVEIVKKGQRLPSAPPD
jgi:hypothetical protein